MSKKISVHTPCPGYVCTREATTDFETVEFMIHEASITVVQMDENPFELLYALLSTCNGPSITTATGYRVQLHMDPHKTALVSDVMPLDQNHTVKSYIQMIARCIGGYTLIESIRETEQILAHTGLENVAELYLKQLTSPERLLLWIAGAIVAKKQVIWIGQGMEEKNLTAKEYNQIIPILRSIASSDGVAFVLLLPNICVGGYDQLIYLREVQ